MAKYNKEDWVKIDDPTTLTPGTVFAFCIKDAEFGSDAPDEFDVGIFTHSCLRYTSLGDRITIWGNNWENEECPDNKYCIANSDTEFFVKKPVVKSQLTESVNRVAVVLGKYPNHSNGPSSIIDTYNALIGDTVTDTRTFSIQATQPLTISELHSAIAAKLNDEYPSFTDITPDEVTIWASDIEEYSTQYECSFEVKVDQKVRTELLNKAGKIFKRDIKEILSYNSAHYGNMFCYLRLLGSTPDKYKLQDIMSIALSDALTKDERDLLVAHIVLKDC